MEKLWFIEFFIFFYWVSWKCPEKNHASIHWIVAESFARTARTDGRRWAVDLVLQGWWGGLAQDNCQWIRPRSLESLVHVFFNVFSKFWNLNLCIYIYNYIIHIYLYIIHRCIDIFLYSEWITPSFSSHRFHSPINRGKATSSALKRVQLTAGGPERQLVLRSKGYTDIMEIATKIFMNHIYIDIHICIYTWVMKIWMNHEKYRCAHNPCWPGWPRILQDLWTLCQPSPNHSPQPIPSRFRRLLLQRHPAGRRWGCAPFVADDDWTIVRSIKFTRNFIRNRRSINSLWKNSRLIGFQQKPSTFSVLLRSWLRLCSL